MKIITLTQPWASLVALGVKTMITCPDATSYVGPVTIYATKTVITIDDPYINSVLSTAGYSVDALPLETKLATAHLVHCKKIISTNIPCYPEYAFSDFKVGWYSWQLADIKRVS